jgi:hypothetical protein
MSKRTPGAIRCVLTDERGLSTTLGYSLTLTITAILITGLLIAGGTLIDDQRERIAEEELSVTVEQLASGFSDADRLASTSTDGELRVTVWLPDRIAGGQYIITTENHSTAAGQPASATIVAEAQAVDVTTELSLRTNVPVANRTVDGGPLVIGHRDGDGDGDRELVINESRNVDPEVPELAVVALDEVPVERAAAALSSVGPDATVTNSDGAAIAVDTRAGTA